MADPLPGTPDRRSARDPPDPQMAQGRSDGGWTDDPDNSGDAARCSDLAAPGEHLSALRLRSLGTTVATTPCSGKRHLRALRRRYRCGVRAQGRRRAVLSGDARANGAVCIEASPGKDPPDRVRPPCGDRAQAAGRGQAGDLRIPRVYAYLREISPRPL